MGEQRSDSKLTSGSAGRIYQSGEKIYQCDSGKEKEAQQKITIDGYECVLVDEWGSEKRNICLEMTLRTAVFIMHRSMGNPLNTTISRSVAR